MVRRLLLVAALILVGKPAFADEVDACLRAHVEVQKLKQSDKLREAKEPAVVCARESCPRVVRVECGRWFSEIEAATPEIVFAVHGPDGEDRTAVQVSVDGAPLTDRIDGSPIAVNPGQHVFRFQIDGSDPIERTVVVRTGEKARALVIDFKKDAPAPAMPPESSAPARPIPTAAYVSAGVGVVALAAAGTLAVLGYSAEQNLRDGACSPRCARSDTDAVRTKYLIADVAGGVGIVALGVAAVFYFTRPTDAHPSARFDATPIAGGAVASSTFRF